MIDKTIGIIGCGNMGEAILAGLSRVVNKSTKLVVSESDPARRDAIQTRHKIIVAPDNHYVLKYAQTVILAVKPQDIDALLKEEICCDLSPEKFVISIAAGVTTARIERIVGKDVPVVRAMPNMPALIGEGMTGIAPGAAARGAHVDLAREIFMTVGEVIEVPEDLMDAVTAISGSGPAYFYYFIEAMIDAARSLGFDDRTARQLVGKTALGSVRLLAALKEDPASLRAKVTSKGGTTAAACAVFDERKLAAIVSDAAAAAAERSKTLAKR